MTKSRMIRISHDFDDYLNDLAKRTGLPKTHCSKLLANSLKDSEIKVLRKKKRSGVNFKFDFTI